MLDSYRVLDATQRAMQIAQDARAAAADFPFDAAAYAMRYSAPVPRRIHLSRLRPVSGRAGSGGGEGYAKSKTVSKDKILHGEEELNLLALEQLVEPAQTRAISNLLCLLSSSSAQRHMRGIGCSVGDQVDGVMMAQLLQQVAEGLRTGGAHAAASGAMLDVLTDWRGNGGWKVGSLSLPRKFEMGAAINRLRSAVFDQKQSD